MKFCFYILTFLFLIPNDANLCTCAPITNWKKATKIEYDNSDNVFIGDVKNISQNSGRYKIEVCQVFKGDLKIGQILIGINPKYCYPIVDKKGEWLFFGLYSNNQFKQNNCGLTRNIANPVPIVPLPPPPPEASISKEEREIKLKKWRIKQKEIVQAQIEILQLKTK